eukprot:TRINITY_DN2035_c0_g1_i1.p2 TRINITY_DN2035_c0_g1~~TRINITY_DN2035_c0_g1_i1.p2  ORF type:complete len:134 (+),score=28.59 TRINITY_DN2035_c0_g1_i1:616-1017(+)
MTVGSGSFAGTGTYGGAIDSSNSIQESGTYTGVAFKPQTTDSRFTLGLGTESSSSSVAESEISYGFRVHSDARLYIVESGSVKVYAGTYQADDELAVYVNSAGSVEYLQNGISQWNSTVAVTYAEADISYHYM